LRIDESPCSAVVVFADLDISEDLPIGETKEITLPALPPGEYPFTCQMQMYRGELVVNEK
jgi:plastocyanin domain-containing protein